MFLPHTFRRGGYDVTVNRNRSIKVRQGDWLSKYSMAIYGDFDHIDKFKRVVNGEYAKIDNPNLIKTGEILYHLDPLPGESGRQPAIIIPVPGAPGTAPELPYQARYVAQFLRWINERFIKTDWYVQNTGGGDLSVSFLTAQYETIGIVKDSVEVLTWFHAVAIGGTIGWPEEISVGGAFSTTQMPDAGIILRCPAHRDDLTLDDFRHGVAVMEFGLNLIYFVGGGNVSIVVFGMRFPLLLLTGLASYFRTGSPSIEAIFLRVLPKGAMILGGPTLGIPGVGFAARAGVMYDRGYWRL